jgi:hypothetical protein
MLLVGLMNQPVNATVVISPILQSLTDRTNYNINLFATCYIPSSLQSDDVLVGSILSITNDSENVPFFTFALPGPATWSGIEYNPLGIYGFTTFAAPDVFSKTYTLTWTNYSIYVQTLSNYVTYSTYSTDLKIDFDPYFIVQPQGQSVFVGSNVVFTVQAIHTSGYQWQKDGTNLVENCHFIGVTNATLTISNVQLEDAGDYTVIANHPDNPATSGDAILGVFKPIQLGLTKSPSDGSYQLQVGNQDSSLVGPNEVSHFTIYTTTNLSLSVSNWDVESAIGILTNGIYQVVFQNDGSPARFWQVGQQP